MRWTATATLPEQTEEEVENVKGNSYTGDTIRLCL